MQDLLKRAMVKSKKERKIDRVNSRYAFLKRKKSLIMKLRERTKQKNSSVEESLIFVVLSTPPTSVNPNPRFNELNELSKYA